MSGLLPAAHGMKVDPIAGLVIGVRGKPVGSNCGGYLRANGSGWQAFCHRLIWEAIHGPIPDGLEINHKNTIKTDNRIENLELVTRSENQRHAHAHGLHDRRGERSNQAKLTTAKVREIRRRYAQGGETIVRLGREFGVTHQTISYAIRGVTWGHIEEVAA